MKAVVVDVGAWGQGSAYDSIDQTYCPIGFLAKQHYGEIFGTFLRMSGLTDSVQNEWSLAQELAEAIERDGGCDYDQAVAVLEAIAMHNDDCDFPMTLPDRQYLVEEFRSLGFELRFSDERGRT